MEDIEIGDLPWIEESLHVSSHQSKEWAGEEILSTRRQLLADFQLLNFSFVWLDAVGWKEEKNNI